jgi:hypothetical protein
LNRVNGDSPAGGPDSEGSPKICQHVHLEPFHLIEPSHQMPGKASARTMNLRCRGHRLWWSQSSMLDTHQIRPQIDVLTPDLVDIQ